MVAMMPYEILYILVSPVVEEPCIAVLALGVDSHIETFSHYHHSQGVTKLCEEF